MKLTQKATGKLSVHAPVTLLLSTVPDYRDLFALHTVSIRE